MRYLLTTSALGLLVACGGNEPAGPNAGQSPETVESELGAPSQAPATVEVSIPVPTYNEEIWYASPGWPGEYPPGFSILDENVVVLGRVAMHDSLPRLIECPLPQNATYQLWNNTRVEADELEFVTVSERIEITINDTAEIDTPRGEFDGPNNTTALSPGDTLVYLRYLGEGWAIMEYQGEELQVMENDLLEISDLREAAEVSEKDMLWVNVPCSDKRGWLLLDDLLAEPGIVLTPITGYGEARDLTDEDREAAIEQASWADQDNEN